MVTPFFPVINNSEKSEEVSSTIFFLYYTALESDKIFDETNL